MIELSVPGMHCGGCAKTITRVLGELDPAAKVSIALDTKRISVETSMPRDAVIARIQDAGFDPV